MERKNAFGCSCVSQILSLWPSRYPSLMFQLSWAVSADYGQMWRLCWLIFPSLPFVTIWFYGCSGKDAHFPYLHFLFQLVRLLNYQSYSAWPIYIYCWEHFYANYLQWKLMECVMCFNPRGHSLLRISGQISFAQMLGWVLLNGVKRGL